MRVKNRIEKPFGPAGASTGGIMFLAGIIYSYFSLIGIILIVIGAFIGFTSEVTFLDLEKNRIKFSDNLFGIIPIGKWIDMNALGWFSGDMHIHRPLNIISDLSLQPHRFFQNLICCGNNPGICLESTLGDNHVRELSHQINVGGLQ